MLVYSTLQGPSLNGSLSLHRWFLEVKPGASSYVQATWLRALGPKLTGTECSETGTYIRRTRLLLYPLTDIGDDRMGLFHRFLLPFQQRRANR